MTVSPARMDAEERLAVPRIDDLRLVIRYRHLLTLIVFWAAVFAASVAMLLPNRYTATVRLLPPQQSQSPAGLLLGQQTTASPLAAMAQKELGLKNPTDLYVGLLNSQTIQDTLIQQFGLAAAYRLPRASDTREELAARTRIQVTKEGLITVAVEDRDATRSAQIANGYAEALRTLTKELAVREAGQRREFYNRQVRQAKDDLDSAESALRAVQQGTGILQLDAQNRALVESATALRSQITLGEVQLYSLRKVGTEQNPDVRREEATLQGWRSELAQLESRQSGDATFSKGRAPAQTQEYQHALREVQYQRAVLDLLVRQFEAAKLDEARETTIIQVVDFAVTPDTNSSPKRATLVVLTSLIAFLGSFAFLHLRQRFVLTPAWQQLWAEMRQEWRGTATPLRRGTTR